MYSHRFAQTPMPTEPTHEPREEDLVNQAPQCLAEGVEESEQVEADLRAAVDHAPRGFELT